jgi:DNA-binding ferritin-like protein (Dps family)/gas vesicle protein
MRADLEAVVALLEKVTQGANQAHEATQRLKTSSDQSFTSLTSFTSFLSLASEKATQTAQTVQTTLTDLSRSAEQTHTQITTRLDDLQEAVKDHSNLWNKAVSELIDAVKIGAVPIEHLISLYGDARIGGQRLTEYLKGLDFNDYQDRVRELVRGLHEGTVEIAQVQEYLGKTQLLFAKQLSDVIELFRKGAVTLKRVEEIVRQVQKIFPDTDFSDLAQALYDALRNT